MQSEAEQQLSALTISLTAASREVKVFAAGLAGALSYRGVKSLAGAAGGMDSADKGFQLLGGTIGGLLMPAFTALGAVALTASDYMQSWIDKNLDSVIDMWTDAIEYATSAIGVFGENLSNTKMLFTDPVGAGQKFLKDVFGIGGEAPLGGGHGGDVPGERKGGAQAGGDFGADNFALDMAKNMKLIAQDMRAQMGNPSMTNPAAKFNEVQMALAKSPLEVKREQQTNAMIMLVTRIADNLEKRALDNNAAVVGGGRRRP